MAVRPEPAPYQAILSNVVSEPFEDGGVVTSLRASYIATTIGVARIAWQVERRRRRSPRDSLDTDAPHEGVEAGRCHDPGERQLTFAVVLNVMRRTARHVDQSLRCNGSRLPVHHRAPTAAIDEEHSLGHRKGALKLTRFR